MAAGNDGSVQRTEDGGYHWIDATGNLSSLLSITPTYVTSIVPIWVPY
jgi:hypothetical protein